MTYVYWVHDETCTDIYLHGYVGITEYPYERWAEHKRVFPKTQMTIIREGTREECLRWEATYRPYSKMAWNGAPGGSGAQPFPDMRPIFKSRFQIEAEQDLQKVWELIFECMSASRRRKLIRHNPRARELLPTKSPPPGAYVHGGPPW